MQQLIHRVILQGASEQIGKDLIPRCVSALAFQQIEPAAGEPQLVLESPDNPGEEAVHRPQRDLRQRVGHAAQRIGEIRLGIPDVLAEPAGRFMAFHRLRQFGEDGIREFRRSLAGESECYDLPRIHASGHQRDDAVAELVGLS